MAKKEKQQQTYLINTYVDTPPSVAQYIFGGVNGEEGKIYLSLTKETVRLARDISVALLSSRGIPLTQEVVGISDPISIVIMSQDPSLSAQEVIRRAQDYYRAEQEQANEDGLVLALTDNNRITLLPTAYDDSVDESQVDKPTIEGADVPEWRREIRVIQLPKAQRILKNPYEARLKSLIDFLELAEKADPIFGITFKRIIDDSFAATIRELTAVETNKAGFRS